MNGPQRTSETQAENAVGEAEQARADARHAAHGVEEKLRHYARCQRARVLTQMDRDPASPTFGCFDRNYWHYKIRDFPSSILQQGAFLLEALRTGCLEGPLPAEQAEAWCVGAVGALGRQVRRGGSVDEYYPFEESYPAAAFGLYAAARLLVDWQSDAPHLLRQIDRAPLRRLARHVAARREDEAANQQAAGLAGLALAAQLPRLGVTAAQVEEHAKRLFGAQHAEGWFNEYGGPDFGYLTVTLDALCDYHDATGDARALRAMDRAVDFLAGMVGADGRLPSTLNSRNTDYVVPYGLARLGRRNATAAWLVETLFRDADAPEHFLWATDDRYHAHYIYASVVRSLPHLGKMIDAQAPTQETTWMPGCGYWTRWAADGTWTAFVAARKGGLLRIHRKGAPPVVDHGWRIYGKEKEQRWTTNWWSDAWAVEKTEDALRLEGPCQPMQYHVPTPAKHGALRVLSRAMGRRLIPWLKRAMIFRPGHASEASFERRIRIDEAGVRVEDRIAKPAGAAVRRAPRQNVRHVASADSFSAEEGLRPLREERCEEVEGAVEVLSAWSGGTERAP